MGKSNHCRICISEEGTIKIFYDTDNGRTISTRIMDCALVKIFLNDGLPDMICEECLQNLNIAFNFKQKCEESDGVLRKMIAYNDKENDYTLKCIELNSGNGECDDSDVDRKFECMSPVAVSVASTGCDNEVHGDLASCDSNAGTTANAGLKKHASKTATMDNILKVKARRKSVRLKKCRKKLANSDPSKGGKVDGSQTDNGRLFVCEVCSKAYGSRRQMRRHQLTHTQHKRYSCSVCDKQFHYKGNLQVHERIHTGERPFLCNSCGKSFAQVSGLQRHLTIHADEKPFGCQLCAKRFKLADTLAGHLRTHTADRPYKCTSVGCDKAFTHHSALNKHMTVHTGERKHRCVHCPKAFGRSDSLAQHLKIHTGERPFGCQTCGAAFSSKSTLRMHLRTHTAEKPYACQYCRKTFAQSSVLTRHLRTHTGERPYQCALCHATFSLKARLTEHSRTCCSTHTTNEATYPPKSLIQSHPPVANHNIRPQHIQLHPNNNQQYPVLEHNMGNTILLPKNAIINVDNLQVNPDIHLAQTQTPSSLSQEDHLRYMQLVKNNHSYYRHHLHQLS